MSRWLHQFSVAPWSVVWLTLVWVLLWGELTVLNVLGGLAVALLVLILFPLPHVDLRLVVRPWPTVTLLSRFMADLVRASFQVAWLAVRPGRTVRGVVMDMQLAGDDELLQTITAEMVGLVPGSVVIELASAERVLTIHALDVRTRAQAQRVRRRVLAQEARVLRAFHPDPQALLDPRRRRTRPSPAGTEGTP